MVLILCVAQTTTFTALKITTINEKVSYIKQTIYIDLLIVLNIFINYFLLLATARLNALSFKRRRIAFGATVGSFFSLIILLPNINFWLLNGLKLVFSIAIVLCSFPVKGIRLFIKNFVVFFIVNFVFAGIMMGVWIFMSPSNLVINNGTVYFQYSLVGLLTLTVLIYFGLTFFFDVYQKVRVEKANYFVEITIGKNKKILKALYDTGNSLTDVFTGKAVVVCSLSEIRDILDKKILDKIDTFFDSNFEEMKPDPKIRYVPFRNVAQEGLLPAITPTKFVIQAQGRKKIECTHLLLAFSKADIGAGEYEVLLNTQLFEKEKVQ